MIILEKEKEIGSHQTGHNSGVINSGLYCVPGSLKAINCQKGNKELIDFCQNENVPHEVCGKVVVATSSAELPWLDELYRRGIANKVLNILD